MIIRTATSHDLDGIMHIEQAAFAGEAWSRALMMEAMRAASMTFLVVVEGERICGYGGLSVAGDDADVQTIAIAPEHRGRGWGKALFLALEHVALQHKAKRMFLDVREDNVVAKALYTAQGFHSIGRRVGYYQDGCAAIVMRKLYGNNEDVESGNAE